MGHDLPYFKVQRWDSAIGAWRDARRTAFDNLELAKAFRHELGPTIATRIVRWDERGATPLDEAEAAHDDHASDE